MKNDLDTTNMTVDEELEAVLKILEEKRKS